MDLTRKLEILADAAKYDASCASSGAARKDSRDGKGIGSTGGMGICHSYTPDGRCVSLLKVLLTNACLYDCHYCINRRSSNVQRARFTPEEVELRVARPIELALAGIPGLVTRRSTTRFGITAVTAIFDDGRALAKFMATQWRGLEAPGKQEQKDKFAYLINNGRANAVWQSIYLDQQNEYVMDRWPYPYLQIHPDDMAELGVKAGDLVEVYNDAGSTQAMVQPTATAKRKETFMLFAYPSGVQGNVVNAGVNEFIIPNYKQTWGNIRKIADAPGAVKGLTFKSWEYQAT